VHDLTTRYSLDVEHFGVFINPNISQSIGIKIKSLESGPLNQNLVIDKGNISPVPTVSVNLMKRASTLLKIPMVQTSTNISSSFPRNIRRNTDASQPIVWNHDFITRENIKPNPVANIKWLTQIISLEYEFPNQQHKTGISNISKEMNFYLGSSPSST